MTDPIIYTAAVIGCGRVGSLYDAGRTAAKADPVTHAGAYAAHDRVMFVGGVDSDEGRRREFVARWAVPAYAAPEAMLNRVRPDLWSICTEPASHLDLVKTAVRAGARAVWCEKPLAATTGEAIRLIAACAEAGVPLLVNHTRRFDAFHQDLALRIQAGEWGRIERVVIHYVRGIANYGSHAFDLLRFLLADEIEWVSASDELREAVPDPSLTVQGQTRGGVPFVLLPIRRAFYDCFEVDVWGSGGRVTITHLGKRVRRYEVGPSPDWAEPAVLLETPGRFLPGMRGTALRAVANIIAHIEGKEPLLSSGQDGLAAMAAVCAAKRSADHCGRQISPDALLMEEVEVIQKDGG